MGGRPAPRLAIVIALIMSIACASDRSPPESVRADSDTTPRATSTHQHSLSETARRYLEAFATQERHKMAAMLDLAEPGSPAAVYAIHQIALVRAKQAADVPPAKERMAVQGNAIRLCSDVCATYANFVGDRDKNQLADFTIDGVELRGRLGLGDGSTTSTAGAGFEVVSAYHTVSGDALFVPVDLSNGPNRLRFVERATTYVGPNGRQVAAQQLLGALRVAPTEKTTIAAVFLRSDLGGRLMLTVAVDEQPDQKVELVVPQRLGS